MICCFGGGLLFCGFWLCFWDFFECVILGLTRDLWQQKLDPRFRGDDRNRVYRDDRNRVYGDDKKGFTRDSWR